ncbi:hypothetical protein [Caulobacter sp. UNC279MFTsu5.1]|uniref:hypothetical protein n=1 Tax=Caulobacter sp. UNC279MFTsu5.1 TaxID=1502775 RepID=UPI0008E82EC5|nr:hypothetical protein [Caulobacter sp. UNC279MFTsu5.1]SFK07321.1 hypothetical protein SAMN02799626_03335 [Caulobacter sp. UNC279MFTsu5.1]
MLALLLAVAAQAAPPAVAADPLAPARIGDLQCYGPDPVRKTCRAMGGYSFGADGEILNKAEVLLQNAPPVTMTTVAPVTVRDGAVCGPLSGVDKAQIAVRGHRLPEPEAAPIRAQLQESMATVLGKEVCTTYRRSGDWWIAEVTMDGVARPDMQDTVLWVPASAGYTVQP